jgi:GNAT superfamily N-acetyltransferase
MTRARVRPATPEDAPHIVRLVRALAEFEGEPAESVRLTEAEVLRDGFGPQPRFEALIAELDGEAVGLALFFPNYSTWEGRAGIYVEDVFVEERARATGVGRLLMAEIARIARERAAPRIDLAVLEWNPARQFYERLGMYHMREWLPYRMEADAIERLASEGRATE